MLAYIGKCLLTPIYPNNKWETEKTISERQKERKKWEIKCTINDVIKKKREIGKKWKINERESECGRIETHMYIRGCLTYASKICD